jgi:D-alanine-D-alanine ligase
VTRRVTILSSADCALAHGTELDALAVTATADMVASVERSVASRGHRVARATAWADPRRTLDELLATEPEVVFHLAESVDGDARAEARVAALCEWARIPHTGSGSLALALALEKPLARSILRARGVPIPRGFVLASADAPLPHLGIGKRWIVKPSREDASHGIDADSVVSDAEELRARVAWLVATYAQPALVEEFVDGREFNVAILGTAENARTLPLAEIDFSGFPAGRPRLVTYAAKWMTDSAEYRGSPSVAAERMHPALEKGLREAALSAWRELGLAGYGRVDLRVCSDRGPLVLDVNPNPDLSPDAGLAKAALRGGISHEELVEHIVLEACDRRRATAPALAH